MIEMIVGSGYTRVDIFRLFARVDIFRFVVKRMTGLGSQ